MNTTAPPIAPIFLSLGTALSAHGRHRDAVEMLRRALDEDEHDKPVGRIAASLIDELLSAEDPEGALNAFLTWAPKVPAEVLGTLPRLAERVRPAMLMALAAEPTETDWLPVLSNLAASREDRVELLRFLARAYLKVGEQQRAATLLEGSAELVADNAELLILLGESHVATGAWKLAESALLRAERAGAGTVPSSDINVRLADVYERSGQPDKALQRITTARATGGDGSQLSAIEAMCRLRLGDLDGAREVLKVADASAATREASVYLELAQHNYVDARDTADKILAKHPNDNGVALLQAQVCAEAGDDVEEIERRLSQILERLRPSERSSRLERSTATRSPTDPGLQYFLALVAQAQGESDKAQRHVNDTLDLLVDSTDEPSRIVAGCARWLRARITEGKSPADAASDYVQAAEIAYDKPDFDLCIRFIRAAASLGELDQDHRWMLADALVMTSYAPEAPKGIATEPLREAAVVWDEAFAIEPPRQESAAWPYVTKARLLLQLGLVDPNPAPLIAEALVNCEGYFVFAANAALCQAFRDCYRFFGLYGLAEELLGSVALPGDGATEQLYPGAVFDLTWAAANAGDLAKMEALLPIAHEEGNPATHLLETARFHLLRGDPAAARQYVDEAERARGISSMLLWHRVKSLRLLGDRDRLMDALATAADVAGLGEQAAIDAWILLLGGEADKARELFEGYSHLGSWLTDPSAEIAFSALAANAARAKPSDDAGYELDLHKFVHQTRSFEDVMTVELVAGLLAERYGDPSGALARTASAAKDRLVEGDWPLRADTDLECLLAAPDDRAESHCAHVAALAGKARLAIGRRDWPAAIAAYQALVPLSSTFPQLEQGLAWLAAELRNDPSADTATISDLEHTVREFAQRGQRRILTWPLEALLGDVWLWRDEADRAADLYRCINPSDLTDDQRPYWLIRMGLVSTLTGHDDCEELLVGAVRAFIDIHQSPGPEIYDASTAFIRTEQGWRRLIDAWQRAAQAAPCDIAPDIAAQVPLARQGLAKLLATEDDLIAAEQELRAAVAASDTLHGPDADETLHLRFELALALYRQEQWTAAEAECRAVLAARERLDGQDSSGALLTRYQLAMTLIGALRLQEAETELRTVLDRERRVQGADNPSTLITQYELAGVLRRQGQLESAETELRSVLDARERKLGTDADETTQTRLTLADVLHERGDLEAAEAGYRAVLAVCVRLDGEDSPRAAIAHFRLAMLLADMPRLQEAEAVLRTVLERDLRVQGPDGTDTLTTKYVLADVVRQQGNLEQAEAQLREVLASRERVLGAGADDTLQTGFTLAEVLQERGELEAAETQLRATLRAATETLGQDDLKTLQTRMAMAGVLRQRGDLGAAEAQYRAVIAAHERLNGEDSPDALLARFRLAMTLTDQQRLGEAETEFRTVLERERRVQGAGDPSTLITQFQLAGVLGQQGDLVGAEAQLRPVVALRESASGADAEDTLEARFALAYMLEQRGELEAAEAEYRELLSIRERLDDQGSAAALHTRFRLAMTLAAGKRLGEAQAELRTVLVGERRALGADDPETLFTQYQLALMLHETDDLDEAADELRAVVATRERVLGSGHDDTLQTRITLAEVLLERGELEDAEAQIRTTLQVAEPTLGADHPLILHLRSELAGVLRGRGQFDDAEAEYRALIAAHNRLDGDDSRDALLARFRLAMTLLDEQQIGRAEAELHTVLERERRVQGSDDPSTLITQYELAGVLRQKGDLKGAEDELRAVLAARERLLGGDANDTHRTRFRLAEVLRQRDEFEAAAAQYRAVLDSRERLDGPDSPDALNARYYFAITLAEAQRLKEAETELRTVLERERRVQGAENPSTLITQYQLAEVLRVQGDLKGAEAELRAVLAARERVLGADAEDTLQTRSALSEVLQQHGEL